jgi:acetyl-CoA carboxylase carboxyltransferase component
MSFLEKIIALRARHGRLSTTDDDARQHARGRLTAEERLALLLDDGSFEELGAFARSPAMPDPRDRDGVITGAGTVQGRRVFVYAQDFSYKGASIGEMHARKIARVIDLALKTGSPVVGLLDSGGARIQEGIAGLDGGGEIFRLNTMASGVVPQISAILGPCAGIAVYSPALTDFVLMTRETSSMFITGPNVIRSVTGEETDAASLGGARAHAAKSGVAHFMEDDDAATIARIQQLLAFLPDNNSEAPPRTETDDAPDRQNDALEELVPAQSTRSYDVKKVLAEVLDRGSFMEVHEHFARNVVVGLGRLNGESVGIVANQPMMLAGCLDINASDKVARFVNFCDAFGIPLVNFVDVTGFLPGVKLEHNGIIRHGAKVLYAYSQATVPKISLVMRKAFGGAYIALVSKDMGYDRVLAWPTAEIAVMGAEGAVSIANARELKESDGDPALRQKLTDEYRARHLNPYVAAAQNRVDAVIEPAKTRQTLIRYLDMLRGKQESLPRPRKHGSIPL